MDCVNLLERFGAKYRISFDEAYSAKGKHRDNLDLWYLELPGRFGTIYPQGGTTLAVMVDRHPQAARQLAALPSCRLYNDGEHEKVFLFDVEDFAKVAAIVRPRRRPRLTEEQRLAAAERLKGHAFQPRSDAATAG